MPLDFSNPDALRNSIQAHIDGAQLKEDELQVVEEAITHSEVSIRAINASDLCDGDKAMVALVMLLAGEKSTSYLSHTAGNLHAFVDAVIGATQEGYRELLRADEAGTDPFASWTPNTIHDVTADSLTISGQGARRRHQPSVVIRRTEAGVDKSAFEGWSPEALDVVIAMLDEAASPGRDSLTRRFKQTIDTESGGIIGAVRTAMDEVRAAKLATIDEGAKILNNPPALEVRNDRRVAQADIDAIGEALNGALVNPEASDVLPTNDHELASLVTADLQQLTDAESDAINAALAKIPADVPITRVVTAEVDLGPRALRLLLAFRALEMSLGSTTITDTLRNQPDVRSAMLALLPASQLDDALSQLLAAYHAPDPQNLNVGQGLPVQIEGQVAQVVPAMDPENDEVLKAYTLYVYNQPLVVREDGVSRAVEGDAIAFDDLSMDALRSLTATLLAVSPASVDPKLGMFRKAAEREWEGVSMASLLASASGALKRKVEAQLADTARARSALETLAAVRDLPAADEAAE